MSRTASVCVALALAAVVTGCATTSESTTYTPPAAPASAERTIQQDHAYMQQVEKIALRRGIGVTWINPPVKRKARGTN